MGAIVTKAKRIMTDTGPKIVLEIVVPAKAEVWRITPSKEPKYVPVQSLDEGDRIVLRR